MALSALDLELLRKARKLHAFYKPQREAIAAIEEVRALAPQLPEPGNNTSAHVRGNQAWLAALMAVTAEAATRARTALERIDPAPRLVRKYVRELRAEAKARRTGKKPRRAA